MNGAGVSTADASPLAETRFPCTPAQERLFRRAQARPDDPALNIALRWEIEGRVAGEEIAQAIAATMARHESLRTRIVEENGVLTQRVVASVAPRFSSIDLTSLPDAERETRARAIAEEAARTPFALDVALLHRQTLLTLGGDRAWLLLTFHHVMFDAGSIDVFHRDFSEALDAVVNGRAMTWAPLDLHYGDYAAWLKSVEGSGALDGDRAFWRRRLADQPSFEIEGDRSRSETGARPAAIVATMLAGDDGKAMEDRARGLGMTTFAFNAGVLAAALAIWTGRDDILFTTQVAGRDEIETEPLIGLFVNDVALRFDATRGRGFDAFLAAVNDAVLEALTHARLPAAEVAALADLPGAPDAPLAAINFMLLGKTRSQAREGQVCVHRRQSVATPAAQYDLNFFMVHWPAGWRLAVEYDATRYELSRPQALLSLWEATLKAALREGRRFSEIEGDLAPMLTGDVRRDADEMRAASARRRREEAEREPEWFQITPISVSATGPTLFAINNSIAYVEVGAALGEAFSVVGVQLFHPDQPTSLAPRTMQDIAADYVRLLRTRQKRGPYHLVGLCVSAVLAYECARQLEAAGEEVALLVVLDSVAPGSITAMPPLPRTRFKWTRRLIGLKRNIRRWRSGTPLATVLLNYRVINTGVVGDWLRASLRRRGLPPAPEDVVRDRWFLPHLEAARAAYRPKDAKLAAPTIALFSDLLQTRFCRDGAGWTRYLSGPLSAGFASGWHDEMLRRGAATIAQAIVRAGACKT